MGEFPVLIPGDPSLIHASRSFALDSRFGGEVVVIKHFRCSTRHPKTVPYRTIRAKKFTAPGNMPGVSYSDHANYWKFGYSALLITDTSIFRNNNYHLPSDTMETLDIGSMAKVIDGVFLTLKKI